MEGYTGRKYSSVAVAKRPSAARMLDWALATEEAAASESAARLAACFLAALEPKTPARTAAMTTRITTGTPILIHLFTFDFCWAGYWLKPRSGFLDIVSCEKERR